MYKGKHKLVPLKLYNKEIIPRILHLQNKNTKSEPCFRSLQSALDKLGSVQYGGHEAGSPRPRKLQYENREVSASPPRMAERETQ